MKESIEEKKRYKMYKSGKHWIVAPIVFFGVIGATSLTSNHVSADEITNQANSTNAQTANTTKDDGSQTKQAETPVTQQASDTAKEGVTTQPTTANEVTPQNNSTEKSTVQQNSTTNPQGSGVKVTDQASEASATQTTKAATQQASNTTVSSTDSSKVNVPSTPVEVQTPELDQAVVEASKDPNITVSGEKENLGAMTKEEADKKKAEIEQDQKNQAEAINQTVKETQEANQKIAAENAKKSAEYEKKLAEHDQSLAEATKNKGKDGYLDTEQVKNLIFDNSTVKNAKLVSVKADNYIDSAKFFAKYPETKTEKDLFQRLEHDSSAVLTKNSASGKTTQYSGGWMAVLQKDKPVVVTYENLDASYDGKKITKVEYTYVLKNTPDKNGRVNAFFHNDPTITITYGVPADPNSSSDTEIELTVRFFGTDGKEILPEKDKPFLYSGASLNSRGENVAYEYMTMGQGNEFLKINGSKVDKHGSRIYSASDIDTGTDGIVTADWDGGVTPKEYYGAGVVSTTERIKFTFGRSIVNNPGLPGNSMWFAFNTDLKAFTVTPEPPTVQYATPKEANVNFKKYELFEVYKPMPTKSVKDVQEVDINHKNVMRGDSLNYEMTWDLNGYGENFEVEPTDVVKGVSFKDDYDESRLLPQKDLFNVTDSSGKNIADQVDVTWDDTKGIVTVTAKDPEAFIKEYGGSELHVFFATKAKANVTGDIVNKAVQNTFGTELETEPVLNHVPKIDPKKDVVVAVGDKHSINNSTVEYGSIFNYQLNSSVRPGNFGGETTEWSIVDTLNKKDQATGQNLVLAAKDFKLKDGTVVKAGTDISSYFFVRVAVNDEGQQVITFTAKKEFLEAMNLKENKETEQGWSAYIQVKRVGYGDVKNTFDESYNGEKVKSNTVVTHTPNKPEQPKKPNTPTPSTPVTPVKTNVPSEPVKPVMVKIPDVQKVPEKMIKASAVATFPKTGEKHNSLLSILGGVVSLLGLTGIVLKKSKKVIK